MRVRAKSGHGGYTPTRVPGAQEGGICISLGAPGHHFRDLASVLLPLNLIIMNQMKTKMSPV